MTEPLEETDAAQSRRRALERVGKLVEGQTSAGRWSRDFPLSGHDRIFVRKVVTNHHTPIVRMADGLNAFANHATELNGSERPLILTPHPGEMARLIAQQAQAVQARR